MNAVSYGPSAFYLNGYYDADEWARLMFIDADNIPTAYSTRSSRDQWAPTLYADAYCIPTHNARGEPIFRRTDIDGLRITIPPNLNLDEIIKQARVGILESSEVPDVEIIQFPSDSESHELNEDPIDLSEFLA